MSAGKGGLAAALAVGALTLGAGASVEATQTAEDDPVWEEVISRCGSELAVIGDRIDDKRDIVNSSWPKDVARVAKRVQRCQVRVLKKMMGKAQSMLRRCGSSLTGSQQERLVYGYAESTNNFRKMANLFYTHCKDDYYSLDAEISDCCSVIPGY